MNEQSRWRIHWFPQRRLDPHFPLALWFAGLWFYLKSFLYFCYVYMAGMDPPPYPPAVIAETIYFGVMIIPALLLGLAMWNEKKKLVIAAIAFLAVDSPVLIFHVLRMAYGGFLDSGLTKALEIGSLGLNAIALGSLAGYYAAERARSSRKTTT
jgi:hypothetical protein